MFMKSVKRIKNTGRASSYRNKEPIQYAVYVIHFLLRSRPQKLNGENNTIDVLTLVMN